MSGRRVRRALLVALLAALVSVGLAPSAGAHPRPARALAGLNTDLWRALLSTPLAFGDPDSPFQRPVCLDVDGVVAPFDGSGATSFTCRVRRGTPVFVAGYTLEASAVEERTAPLPQNASAAGLRRRALSTLPARPTVRYDGEPVDLVQVVGRQATVCLPQPTNLLGAPDTSTTFVAVGWVTLVVPSPGRHVVEITAAPTTEVPDPPTISTYLQVTRRHHR